jgi:hypothetical protein
MDRRRNNGGHSTKGKAGRKPKADEIAMIERMDSTLVPTKAWEKLAELVNEGNIQAIRTWLEYRYGKPTQLVEQDVKPEPINIPIITWIKTGDNVEESKE